MGLVLRMRNRLALSATLAIGGTFIVAATQPPAERWLAGDTHVHSQWSPGYDQSTTPPTPVPAGDARYPTPTNARMAERFGLDWIVTTDHGGPNHSKLNLERAYPELVESRTLVPNVVQFYGMELNMPGMDHHALIIPRTDSEAQMLFDIEHRFDANEAWPADKGRNTAAARIEALTFIESQAHLPLLFANHPSRSARGDSMYGDDEPSEFRQNMEAAPSVYRGFEGAPGHQAGALLADGTIRRDSAGRPAGNRGGYASAKARTRGGFDPMTAIVGGLWDTLLGEGRRFWIVAASDSHVNYADPDRPGNDFWPGQFHKIYVRASKTHDSILENLRAGRMFVTAGDLISSLDVDVTAGRSTASIGGTVRAARGREVDITIRFVDPATPNFGGFSPEVKRVDLIVGEVHPSTSPSADHNPTARVIERFLPATWIKDRNGYRITTKLRVSSNLYLRVRGTSSGDLEPEIDQPGENPWTDLWFYSNPVFIEVN